MSAPVTSLRRFFKRNSVVRQALAAPVIFYTRVRIQARKRARLATVLVLGITVLSGLALNFTRPAQTIAATSNTINFQARLETAAGAIVPDGNYNVEFKLYSASSGGTALWTEDYYNNASHGIQVANGYLTANLGSLTAFPGTINWDQQLWLTMNIGGTTTGTPTLDGEMSPRLALTALPYAFRAGVLADPANSGATLSWAAQGAANSILLPNAAGTICLQASASCGFATGTSASYIQNTTSVQASSNFNISGNGTIGTNLTVSGTSLLTGAFTANGQLNIIQPASSLTSGQSNITQTLTNGSSTGGTVNGYNQTITVSNTVSASNTNGINLTLTDNGTGGNADTGINVTLSGSNGSRGEIGVNSSVTRGLAIQGITSGSTGGSTAAKCNSVSQLGVGVCAGDTGGSNAGAGLYAYTSSRATSTIADPQGSGVFGLNQSAGGSAGAWYAGVKGLALQSSNTASTSLGVFGQATGGTGASVYGGYFTLGSSSTATAGAALYASNSSTSENILQLQDNTTSVLTVANEGAVTLQNSTNSPTAFQVQTTTATSSLPIVTADTSGLKLQVGSATTDANAVLLVADSYNNATDPTGTNGAVYYNTSLGAFRCFQNGTWTNCVGGGNAILNQTTLQTNANFHVQSAATGSITGQIQALSGQTADLLDFEDSTGKVLSGFTANGSLQGGNASGSNVAGSNLVLNGGQGTGTANGGNINFQVADPGTSGSTLNSLATVASLSGANGAATFQNSTDSTTAFQVQNVAGASILNVDTSNAQTTASGSLVVFANTTPSGGGANGGAGSGVSGDHGGGGGGGIGTAATPANAACAGDNGAQGVDVSGLFTVVSGLGFATTGPGSGNGTCTSGPNNNADNGNPATGFGSGGGGASYYGGNGGNGLYGGGGGGAAGFSAVNMVGGTGGQGVVVISPTGGTNVAKTSGTSYTVPAGITTLKIWAIGAGGGGAGSTNVDSTSGGAGGAGGVVYRTFAVTPGQVITYSLGTGGTGGTNTNGGSAGGSTTATVGGVTVTANGGSGGQYNNNATGAGGTYLGSSNVVPFQVQNASGASLLSTDTTNMQVSVAGNLNATTYSVNGTPGANVTCATGTSLQGATVVSGIVTGGSCVGASYAIAYNSANQSIANVTVTTLALNSERQDTDNFHDNVTNNSRLTAPSAGFYHITANWAWDPANVSGNRYADVLLNGATVIAADRRVAAGYSGEGSLSIDYYLNAGDYVQFRVYQDTGGALNLIAASNSPVFSIFKTSAANGGGGGGTLSVGTLDSQTKSLNGAVISSNNLYLQTADASNPGLVSTSAQTFAGDKTFNGVIIGTNGASINGTLNLNTSGSGATSIGNTTSGGAINLATSGNSAITLNASGSSNTGVVAKTVNSSTAAFQVQNTAGASVLNVDTVNTTVTVTGTNSTGSQTFNYTGGSQTYTVPAGVTSISVTLNGAGGGSGGQGNTASTGGQTTGTMSVTPGQVLTIYVGGAGGNGSGTGTGGTAGYNGGGAGGGANSGLPAGGGGGGSSMIKSGTTLLAAAGGGGGGAGYGTGSTAAGGNGGGTSGNNGGSSRPGIGGNQSTGGAAGGSGTFCGTQPTAGSSGQGGAGGIGIPNASTSGAGGGGGGYFGGGGGDCGTATGNGGGGGGSGYNALLTGGSMTTGGNSGNGQVILSFVAPALQVGDSSGNTYFSVNPNAGSTLVKGTSTTAFQVQNTAGTTLLTADTSNLRINVVGDTNVGSRFGNRLFSDDFESGNFTFWDQGTGGTITNQTSIVHDGKYAAQTNFTSGTGYASATVASNNTVYARAWVYVTTQSTDANLLTLQTTTGQSFTVSRLNSGGNLDFWNGVANVHTSGAVISTGGWHLIEMQVTIGSGTGTSQVWLDGTSTVSLTAQSNGTNQLKTVKIGDSTGGHTFNAYYDDVAADTATTGTASSLNVDDSFHVGGTSSFGNSVSLAQSSNILFGTNAQIGENSSTNLVVAETSGGVYVQSHILQFQDNYNNYANEFTIQNAGQATFQNATNSNTAFQVQNASGAAVLLVDTTSTDATGATVNYLKYPGFEAGSFSNAAAGWAPVAPGTLAQNNNKTNTYNGLYSAQLVTTASNGGITTSSFNSAPAGSASYIVSFYAKVSTGTMSSGSFTVTTTGGAGTCTGTGPTINSSGFQRVYCTVAAGAGTITALSIAQNDGTARTIYIDGVQMQSTTFNGGAITAPTPYDIGGIMLRGIIQNPLILQPNSDSTSIFQVNNAAGTTTFLNVDTTNSAVTVGGSSSASATTIQSGSNGVTINANSGAVTLQTTSSGAINIKPAGTSNVVVGTSDTTGTLLVLDTDTDTTETTAVAGGMYYNSALHAFRCSTDTTWANCGGFTTSMTNSSGIGASSTAENAFTTTAATDQTYTIPANFCQPGRVIHVHAQGYFGVTSATTPSLTFRLRLDSNAGTLLGATATTATGSGVTNQGWYFDTQLACKTAGTSGTVDAEGWYVVDTTSAASFTQGPFVAATPPADITVNTTTSHALVPTAQFSLSGASNTATLRQFTITSAGP